MLGRSTMLLALAAAAHGFKSPLVPAPSKRTLSSLASQRWDNQGNEPRGGSGYGGRGREERMNRRQENLSRGQGPGGIDDDRRNRSPGMRNNFYDKSTADFKRPHGMSGGAAYQEDAPAWRLQDEEDSMMRQQPRENSLALREMDAPTWRRSLQAFRPGGGRLRSGDQHMTATYALIVATFFTFVADNILRMNLMKGNE